MEQEPKIGTLSVAWFVAVAISSARPFTIERSRDPRFIPWPLTTSYVELTPQEREALGIPEGLVRYSVGIEDTEDLIADLTQALLD
jgi:hypothetical protein